ncbi:hypothetical protein BaRGS_00028566, partial [Batillaria attramentaria]
MRRRNQPAKRHPASPSRPRSGNRQAGPVFVLKIGGTNNSLTLNVSPGGNISSTHSHSVTNVRKRSAKEASKATDQSVPNSIAETSEQQGDLPVTYYGKREALDRSLEHYDDEENLSMKALPERRLVEESYSNPDTHSQCSLDMPDDLDRLVKLLPEDTGGSLSLRSNNHDLAPVSLESDNPHEPGTNRNGFRPSNDGGGSGRKDGGRDGDGPSDRRGGNGSGEGNGRRGGDRDKVPEEDSDVSSDEEGEDENSSDSAEEDPSTVSAAVSDSDVSCDLWRRVRLAINWHSASHPPAIQWSEPQEFAGRPDDQPSGPVVFNAMVSGRNSALSNPDARNNMFVSGDPLEEYLCEQIPLPSIGCVFLLLVIVEALIIIRREASMQPRRNAPGHSVATVDTDGSCDFWARVRMAMNWQQENRPLAIQWTEHQEIAGEPSYGQPTQPPSQHKRRQGKRLRVQRCGRRASRRQLTNSRKPHHTPLHGKVMTWTKADMRRAGIRRNPTRSVLRCSKHRRRRLRSVGRDPPPGGSNNDWHDLAGLHGQCSDNVQAAVNPGQNGNQRNRGHQLQPFPGNSHASGYVPLNRPPLQIRTGNTLWAQCEQDTEAVEAAEAGEAGEDRSNDVPLRQRTEIRLRQNLVLEFEDLADVPSETEDEDQDDDEDEGISLHWPALLQPHRGNPSVIINQGQNLAEAEEQSHTTSVPGDQAEAVGEILTVNPWSAPTSSAAEGGSATRQPQGVFYWQ